MKYSNTVEYNIKTSLDSKGLTQLKSELQGLELKLQNMGNKGLLDEKTFVDARNQIQGLGQALTDAFNPSLGMLDLSKLNQELKNNDITAQGLKTAFSSLGAEGQVAFNNLVGELGKLDTGILRTNSQVDKLFTTFSNTFRWGLVSSFFSQFMNAIHSSVDYVKELDDSLTQIMLVTDYNRDSMNQFAKSANEAAKAVSMTTTGMTNASLIFAQQGYDLGQSQELATLSAKLANASQQDTATTSDQITAYMNAYGLENSIAELTQQMDNWALIANVSAADVGELAQASQRAASMANAVGVSGEQLAAQIATIESVTREAPEQIGNGLKTLYARFSDIAAGGEDEDGFGLGKVTSELNAIGVQIFDQVGQIRDVGDIMEDLMVIWDDLDQTSKVAASQALAGKYQVNRFMALMDNSDMYQEYKGATGSAATGTLDQMNEEYANSIEGRSAKLQASLEGLFSTIFNTDDIYPWMDAAQGAVDLLQQFFDALGGGKTVLLGISSLLMQVFSKNMAQEINNAVTNRAVQQQKLENLQNSQAALTTLGAANPNPNDINSQNILNFAQYMQTNAKNFNAEQMDQANSILQELVQNSNAATMAADKLKDSLSVIGTGITATTGESILAPFDSEGAVNATLLSEALQNMSQSEVADMFSHIQEDIKPAREGLLEFNKALQNYQQELRNADSTDNSWSQSVANLQVALDHLKGKIDPSTYERYEQAIEEISQVTKNAGDKTAETTAEVAKLADGLEKVAAKDLTNLDQLNKDAFQAKNTQMAAADSNKVAGAFQKGMDSQAQIQGILNTLNAVQQLTFAWQTFQNLGSIWSNANLSEGEKFVQTIMALGTTLPSVITAVQSLQTVMDSLIAKDKEYIAQKIASQTQTEAAAVQEARAAVNKAKATVKSAQANITEAKTALAAADANVAQAKAALEVAKAEALKNANYDTYSKVIAAEQGLKEAQIARAQAVKSLASAQTELKTAQTGLVTAVQVLNGAMTAYSIATGIAEGATEGFSTALTFLEKHPVIIALTAIAMAATTIFGIIKAQAEEAKQQAQEAFDEAKSKLEQIQSLQQSVSEFNEKYNSYKQTGEGDKDLIEQANAIADAMREAGAEEQANTVHLAAMRAEAAGTAENFDALANSINNAQESMSQDVNAEAITAANKLLETEKVSIEDVIRHQNMLKDAQEELNNLDPWDPNYESQKEQLESLIETLQNAKLAQEELVDAANVAVGAGVNSGMQEIAKTEGQQMQVYGKGDATGAGPPALAAGVMDWSAMQEYLSQTVEGFGALDELDQLAIAAQNVATEAQAAEIQVRQLLLANENLDESTTQHYSREGDYTLYGREGIQDVMQNEGFDSEQQVKILASLDENASEQEIMAKIQEIKAKMETTNDFDLALKATLDPEQAEEMLQNQINNYQPTDEDIDADQFKSMANYIHGADDSAFEEGGMFEDLSSDIRDNADALEDFVEGILRYEDAISTLAEKEEDWRNALADGADLADRVEAINELKETYSDFLDLGDDVSNSFAENTEHLDDMAAAAEGDVDAYNRLLAAASEDIAINIYGIDESSAALQGMSDYLQSDAFKDVEVGMSINDEDFYNNLNAMIAEGNWSREQIEAYLNNIGCSLDPSGIIEGATEVADVANQKGNEAAAGLTLTSEVDSMTAQEEDTNEATSLDVQQIPGEPWTANVPTVTVQTAGMPAATSVPISGTAPPSFKVTAKPVSTKDTKEMSASSVKTEQGGSGTTTIKPGSVKKNSSGGSKSNHSSSPSSGGGGRGKGSCFIAGTLISTSLGFKPIEQIRKEDIVLSYNKSIGLNEYSKVLQTMIHDTTEPIYTLYIKNEQLRVTGIHRFFVTDKITFGIPQWVHAANLKVGDWVLFADGTWHVIHKIEVNIEHQTVYNFEVSHNHNYYVGRNQILAHNKGGSGGKGGSGKAQEPKKINSKEKKEHEKNYYEEVDNQISKIEKTLSKIEKQEDRLIGTKARANQNRQLNILKEEIKLQEKKLDILEKQEQVDVWKALKDKDKEAQDLLNANGIFLDIPDAHVDEQGIIENYEEISAAIDKAHNELIDKYNAAAAASDEEETKRLDEQIKKFDDLGESILKNSQRANEIRVEIEDLNSTLQDLRYSIQDIRNEAYETYKESQKKLIELNEDAAELKGIFRDFDENSFMNAFSIDDSSYEDLIVSLEKLNSIYNVSKDDATAFYDELIQKQEDLKNATDDTMVKKAAEDTIRFYREQQSLLSDEDPLANGELGRATRELEMLKRWIDNPDAEDNIFKDDEATLWKMYEEASEDAKKAFENFREEVQNYRDAILDIYDDQEDAIDRQIDQFDRLTEKVERISDTYTLYYGEDSYDQLDKFYAQQGNVMQNQLDQLTNAYNHWQQQYQKALDTGDKKLIQEIQDKMDDAEDAMLDAAQELAELWVEKFENAVEASSQHIYKDLFGSNDISELTDNWELQKDYMERYKDDVEKAYEIDKLRNKYLDLLDEAQGSSAQTQNRIRQQMQEQLDLLQNQTTVSEYDVKLANAKLEILQKQMALEDAQRNKNKMQLRRDTQGNYRYIYTADRGNVREAQQDLEDSEYDAYEMTKQETISNNDRAINLLQDYIQKRAAIWNKYKDDATARGQALAELEAEYEKTFDALAEDFTDTSSGMYDILNWLVKNGSEDTTTAAIEMLDTLYDKNGEVKDKTGQDWMDLASLIQDQVLPKIEDAVTKANLEMEDQAIELKDSMTGPNGTLTKIGSGAEDVANSMDMAAESTRALASATEELFTALGADDSKLKDALDKVSQYDQALQKTQSTTSSLANQLGVANKTVAAKTAEASNYRTTLDYLTGAKDFEAGQDVRIKQGAYVAYHRDGKSQWDSEGRGGFNIPRDMTVHIFNPDEQLDEGGDAPNNVAVYPVDAEGWGEKRWEEFTMTTDQQQHQMWHINKDTLKKFLAYDTGGYTGEWNESADSLAAGKVALLHQKELVLNATDTENILNAVNIMRDITDSIKTSSAYVSAFKAGTAMNNQEIIEQRVEISATFPNVSSITDIEQALMNLSDQAYIYANKTI